MDWVHLYHFARVLDVMTLFELLIFGHLWGDFMTQNKWMAMNKGASHWKCFVHCAIYTLCVTLFTLPIIVSPLWSLFIFATHYPIDRWSLADKWLNMIGGRALSDFIENGKKGIPDELDRENYHVLRGAFSAKVYTIVDSTMHLTLMYFGYYAFFR